MAGERELGVGGEDVDFPLRDRGVGLLVQEDGFAEVELAGYELLLGLGERWVEGGGDVDHGEWVAGVGGGGEDIKGCKAEGAGLRIVFSHFTSHSLGVEVQR